MNDKQRRSVILMKQLCERLLMVCLAAVLTVVVAPFALFVVAQSGGREQFEELIGCGDRFKRQDEYAFALGAYQEALRAAERSNNRRDMARAHLGRGEIFGVQVKFSHALEASQQSLTLSETIGDTRGAAHANDQLGYVYYRLYYYDSAERHLEKAFKQFESIDDRGGMASVLNHLGRNHISQGNSPAHRAQALDYYTRSIEHGAAGGNEEVVAGALNNLGNLYLQQHDFERTQSNLERAEAVYHQALAKFERLGNRRRQGIVLGNLSRTYLRFPGGAEVPKKSAAYAERAIAIFRRIGDDDDLWEAYRNLGMAYIHSREAFPDTWELAVRCYEEAIKTVEKMRREADGDELTLQRYFRGQTSPYSDMIYHLANRNRYDDALGYAERAKARQLLDMLQRERTALTLPMIGMEREAEQRLKDELFRLNDELWRANRRAQSGRQSSRRPSRAGLRARREAARQSLLDFGAQTASARGEIKESWREMQPINAEEAAALLPDSQSAILEYALSDHTINLFVLTREEEAGGHRTRVGFYQTHHLSNDYLRHEIAGLRRRLARRDNGYRESARLIYDLLIKPAREHLRGKHSLIIVPDAMLWDVPFQVLLDEENRYLIETAAISYAPSLTVLREMKARGKENRQDLTAASDTALLALGNPALGQETIARTRERYRDARLEPLPEAEREVALIGKLYNSRRSKIYTRAEAREELVKREAGRFEVLHLATHAIVNNENPMFSALVLSQAGKASGEDGLLEAWEIMRLKLDASLVVLSACETAGGQASEGEGMMGLSWAFLAAGVPTLVVSQWSVESASTSELMIEFHRLLRQPPPHGQTPLTKAEALRQASLTMLKRARSPHPFYWAGFVVVGDGG